MMEQMNDDRHHPGELEKSEPRKKTYRKPQLRFERVFETSSTMCGKVGTIRQNCITMPMNS